MKSINRDPLVTGLVCGVVGLFVFVKTLTYPQVSGQGFGQGPAFYPQLLAATLIGLGLLILIHGLRASARSPAPEKGSPGSLVRVRSGLPYLVLGLSIVLMALMRYVGFFVSGFALVAVTIVWIKASLKPGVLVRGLLFSLGINLFMTPPPSLFEFKGDSIRSIQNPCMPFSVSNQ